jgi:vacuolar-type H+-ATPase subunit I/STV1
MRWIVFTLLVLAGLSFLVATVVGGSFTSDGLPAGVSFVISTGTGGLIIARRDGHATGWLLVLVGLTIVFANGFSSVPGVPIEMISWVESWVWTLVFALYALLALTFPSGHLPKGDTVPARFGRAAVWTLPVLVGAAPFTEILGGPEVTSGTPNPVGFIPSWLSWAPPLGTFLILFGVVISLVVRRRRAVGVERAQLSWVVFALLVLAIAIAGTFVFILGSIAVGAGDPEDDAWTVVFMAMTFFPVAVAIAILRYKLFEIDRIVSRTVSYTLVIGALAAVFAVIAVGLPQLLDLPDESPRLVAAATLAVAALFNPLRRRIHTVVDRRFNRARYDAQQEIDGLAGRLRNQVDLSDLTSELTDVLAKTLQPASASVWIRRGR